METPFNITREEVLELAANKLADQYDGESLYAYAKQRIDQLIKETVETQIKERVESFLLEEMTRIVNAEIYPLDMFGERAGKPTSLKQVLAEQVKEFWNVKVNKDGKSEYYGGRPRYQVVGEQMMQSAFNEALKDSASIVTAEFKKALVAGLQTQVAESVNKLIKVN